MRRTCRAHRSICRSIHLSIGTRGTCRALRGAIGAGVSGPTELHRARTARRRLTRTGGIVPVVVNLIHVCLVRLRFVCAKYSSYSTSAARDASNATLLLDGLRDLGLEPQVSPGEVEARLTFFGVAHDFAGERIIVADSGGGSTELATGVYAPERGVFALEGTRSLDIGCRRVTERFFSALPPTDSELAAAGVWAGEQFGAYFEGLPVDFERAERLVAVGGTVTTLVALVHELEPYDSNFVHLRELSMEQISAAIERMSALDVAGIAALPGVQPKRAGVILAGAVVIRELMRAGGYDMLTVSENSLLAGMAATINETLDGVTPTIAWTPTLSAL